MGRLDREVGEASTGVKQRVDNLPTADVVRILIGCSLGLAVTIAPAFIAPFGVLARPMAEEFGWRRAALTIAITITSLGGVLLTPLAGLVIDRMGARPVALVGALTFPFALALQALVPTSYAAFLGAAGVVAIVSATAHPATYLSVLARFFDKRLGIAVALGMVGLGIGQAVTSLLAQVFFESFGWRGAWLGVAGVIAIVGAMAFLTVPWRLAPPLRRAGDDGAKRSFIWPTLLRSPLFWVLTLALLLILMVAVGIALSLVAALRDNGVSGMTAVAVFATLPLFSMAGRLLTGVLIDRISYVAVGAVLFAGQSLGCVILTTSDSLPMIYLAVALIGVGYGADSDLLPYVIRRRFGVAFFGTIIGLMAGMMQTAIMIGPLLAAWTFDRFGTYRPAFLVFAGASMVAAALWMIAPRLKAPDLGQG